MKLLRSIRKRFTRGQSVTGSDTETKTAEQAVDPTSTRRRLVSFAPLVSVYPPSPLCKEELGALWYNRTELADIKAECEVIVKAMMCQTHLDSGDHTTRGLECRTAEGCRRRQKLKLAALDAVLDEQDLQWEQNINDQEEIARVYQKHSAPRQGAAHQAGLRDERSILTKISTKIGLRETHCRPAIMHHISETFTPQRIAFPAA